VSRDPSLLWQPSEAFAERTRMRAYMRWLADERGVQAATYDELWRWSVGDLEGFW
jgi:acetoacetyl-CoA synthetase